MENILKFAERLYNTLRYNGFYIFLSLLFPYIIWKFDAGSEIIVSMAEQGFSLNIALSLATFSASCLSIWCVPTLAIRFFQVVTGVKDKPTTDIEKKHIRNCLYQQIINVYNGRKMNKEGCCSKDEWYKSQLPVRYFAVAPWGLFVLSCIQVFVNNAFMIGGLLLIIGLIILIDRFRENIAGFYKVILSGKGKPHYAETFVIRYKLLALLYLAIIVILFFVLQKADKTLLQWLLISLNLFFMLVFYSFLLYMENSKLEEYVNKHKADGEQTAPADKLNLPYRISNINYRILLVYLIVAIVAFYFLNQYQLIELLSPVVIIVTMATVLIVFFELFFTSQLLLINIVSNSGCSNQNCSLPIYRKDPSALQQFIFKLYNVALIIGVIAIVNLYFFSSANSHRIRKQVDKKAVFIPETMRLSLNDYFQQWLKKRNFPGDSGVVYLISGQGGGSRAAAWFFMNMSEQFRDSNIFKNVFSISTVSGSTSGANMFLASRFKGLLLDDSAIKYRTMDLYGRNYMSSSFYGIMIGDFIESILDAGDEFPRDRNYHLQKEELAAFERTFKTNGKDFFENDFLWPYQVHRNRNWPLFCINSTVVNFGTRAVFSPVKMDDFSIARDLYLEFKKSSCNDKDNIPMVTCVNQSQAFPILSAYNYMDCVGRLGDGGISENTGCATTLEIYKRLRKYCNDSGFTKIKLVCVNITNGNLESNFKTGFSRASIFNTFSAAINSPFDGSATYAYKNLKREVSYMNNDDTVVDLSLDSSITLTRTMSRRSVDSMYSIMKAKKFVLPK